MNEEVVMAGGSRGAVGRVDEARLAGLIRPVVAAAGMDTESVRLSVAGKRRLLRVIVDSDAGVSLDAAALVSREISAALDATDVMGDVAYTLEVSSPGVDRPLTEPRHWRRAAGRLVRVTVPAAGTVRGRVLAADAGRVTLDVDGTRRDFSYAELGPGAVQVEFGRLPDVDTADDELAVGELTDHGHPDDGVPDEVQPYEADLGAGGDGY